MWNNIVKSVQDKAKLLILAMDKVTKAFLEVHMANEAQNTQNKFFKIFSSKEDINAAETQSEKLVGEQKRREEERIRVRDEYREKYRLRSRGSQNDLKNVCVHSRSNESKMPSNFRPNERHSLTDVVSKERNVASNSTSNETAEAALSHVSDSIREKYGRPKKGSKKTSVVEGGKEKRKGLCFILWYECDL